jgi:hypothetical protein
MNYYYEFVSELNILAEINLNDNCAKKYQIKMLNLIY